MSTSKAKGGLFLASSLCDGLEDNNIRQVATLLLSKDADPNVLIPTHGVTPFHLVIGNDSVEFAEEVTKLFLRHGGDPNVRSNDGMTPVHVAAAWGRLNILKLLLANGGDPLCLDNDGCSPFHYAFDGKYFKAVTLLAKYCEDNQDDDDDDEPKYNMMLDKVLLTNGDVIAEYVASHNVVLDLNTDNIPKNNMLPSFYNCKQNSSSTNLKSDNVSEISNVNKIKMESVDNTDMEYEEDTNIKSTDLSITNDRMIVEQTNFSQADSKDMLNCSFVDLDLDFASLHLSDVMQKEKCLVSKIISHLSTTLTSDCTINETLQNYKKNKYENSNVVITSDNSPTLKEKVKESYEREHRKTPKNFLSKLKHNRNKDILKPSTLTVKKQCSKFSTGSTSRKKYKKTSDKVLLTPPYILDNSIVSMSPNFNTPNHRKRINTTKTPLILSYVHNDDIVSRSSNSATPARAGGKRNIEKTLLVNNCLSPKILKKSHEHKTQMQHSEFNRCKKYITQSTPRRKKRSIYKLYSNRKRFDCYRQEDDVTTDEYIVRKTLKPINLGKTIFSEETEDVTRHDILNSSFNFGSSLNSNKTVEMEYQNYYNRYIAMKLDSKYDEDNNSDSSQMDLDNSFNQIEKKESIDSSDNDKKDDMKYENKHINSPFVTIRKNSFKIEKATGSTNSAANNIESTYSTISLHGENYVDCVDCDTMKLLNEDIHMNISKTCNLHAKSWCSNKLHEFPFLRKSELKDDSHILTVNLPVSGIYLSNSSKLNGIDNSIDSKRTEDTYKTGNSSVHKIEGSSSLLSYVTTEEYKYEDLEQGIVLLERRLCNSPFITSSGSERDVTNMFSASGTSSKFSVQSLPRELLIDDVALRRELTQFGDRPGPITNTTRKVYQKRLMHLRSINALPRLSVVRNISRNYDELSHRVFKSHLEFGDWVNHLDTYRSLEKQVFQEFASPNPSRRWREGRAQTSFNYLLLDPRVTQDLQHRNAYLTEAEVWSIFLNAIFYIGKGKRSRPFAHLYDAFNVWVSKSSISTNKKINCILDIWNNDHGVICLHVFQNAIAVEAYTREAVMIDALGTECLGNCKAGDYYGIAATWSLQQKQKFGRYLLYKALQILLHEGERQLFPQNL